MQGVVLNMPELVSNMQNIWLLMLYDIPVVTIPPIMFINRIYGHQNLLSLQLVSFLVGLRTYQHPCQKQARYGASSQHYIPHHPQQQTINSCHTKLHTCKGFTLPVRQQQRCTISAPPSALRHQREVKRWQSLLPTHFMTHDFPL